MPYIHIRIASEHLSSGQIHRLSAGATRLMADCLRKRPEVTVVSVETLPPKRWFLAGNAIPTPRQGRCTLRSRALTLLTCHSSRPAGACAAAAEIKITQGTNTTEEKAAFLAAFHRLLGDCLGPFDTPAYVVIH
jgi:4-oxalocrotonate tautomerase